MNSAAQISAKNWKILYVDDELLSLKYFKQIVGEEYGVITAASAEEALAVLADHADTIGVVVSDQRLPGTQGTEFLSQLRKHHPDIVRILATAYSDIATAISAINEGAIYIYISKPWDPEALMRSIRQAMERFVLRFEKERLLQEKSSMMQQLVVSDRLAGYGVLAEGINHHLRNALVPVQTYLELVAANEESPISSEDEMMLELRQAARAQVRRITDMLLRLSSVPKPIQKADSTCFTVEDVWHEALGQLAESLQNKVLEVNISAPPNLPEVYGSRTRLSHFVRLILEDELERLPLNQSIVIDLQHGFANGMTPEHIRMEISDSGPPVDDTRLGALFTPFFVRPENPQYLGMNLATCYVTLHGLGGWAQAFNEAKRGTVLVFCLPVKVSNEAGSVSSSKALEHLLSQQTNPLPDSHD
jgi:FixJ family two-component response regulator